MIDLDREGQSSKKPETRNLLSKKTICDEPSMWSFLKILEMLLNDFDLGGVARVCWIIELRNKLDILSIGVPDIGMIFNLQSLPH